MSLHSRPLRVLVLAVLPALFLMVQPAGTDGPALAHGDGTEIARETFGAFTAGFRILPLQPLVGLLHVTVTLEDAATGANIADAIVKITARRRDDPGTAILSPALNSPAEPRYYDANFDLEHSGLWDFSVTIEHERGDARMDVPVFVGRRTRGGDPGPAGAAIFALVTVALLGGGGWVAWTARKRGRRGPISR